MHVEKCVDLQVNSVLKTEDTTADNVLVGAKTSELVDINAEEEEVVEPVKPSSVADGADGVTEHEQTGLRGDEDEVESNEILRADDDTERIPDDFYYDYAAEICKPFITAESGLPSDLLALLYPLLFNVNDLCKNVFKNM